MRQRIARVSRLLTPLLLVVLATPAAFAAQPAASTGSGGAAKKDTIPKKVIDSLKKVLADSVKPTVRRQLFDSIKAAGTLCIAARPLNAVALVVTHDSATGKDVTTRKRVHCLPYLEVFGDGNVKDVLGGKESAQASGALGLHYTGPQYDVTGLVNVAGTNDTVKSRYGTTILLPASGAALNAAALTIRYNAKRWDDPKCAGPDNKKSCNWGLRLHTDASTRLWAKHKAPPPGKQDSVTEAFDVPMWGGGFDLSYTFFREALVEDDGSIVPVGMVLDAGYVHRAVRGDINAKSNADVRRDFLTTSQKNFDGYEVGLSMVYNRIRTSFTYVWLDGNAEGVSHGQIVAAVDIRAALRSRALKRE